MPRNAPPEAAALKQISTAILGGSFDPVHLGHMTMARLALERLGMNEVLFIPACFPPHKPSRRLAEAYHRHAMLALATLEEPRFRVSTQELTRGGRSYTIDTLKRLRHAPGARRWFFLVGADTFLEIGSWKSPRAVLDRAEFIVFPRRGTDLTSLRRKLPGWIAGRLLEHAEPDVVGAAGGSGSRSGGRAGGAGGRRVAPPVHWVPLDAPDVSSSDIRRRATQGRDLSGFVPALVAHYIAQYGLYRRGKAGTA